MNPRILLGGLIPLITSPIGLVVVGVGALGYTLYSIFTEKEEEQEYSEETVHNGSEPYEEPYNDDYLTVQETVEQPWETVVTTVEETVNVAVKEPLPTISDEDLKKEMIRQAMSELGKRSAVARKLKKINK
jgi:type IV secretory pathway VirB10-like protein